MAGVHDALRDLVRVYEGRDPQPTAASIDSQSVHAATLAKPEVSLLSLAVG